VGSLLRRAVLCEPESFEELLPMVGEGCSRRERAEDQLWESVVARVGSRDVQVSGDLIPRVGLSQPAED
jgi:hypothetical protein